VSQEDTADSALQRRRPAWSCLQPGGHGSERMPPALPLPS